MIEVVLVVLVLVLVALVAGVLFMRSRAGLLAGRCRRQVIVTLKDGAAFSGLLFAVDRDCLVLREAHALAYGPGQSNVIVEGEALVLRADVSYIQVP